MNILNNKNKRISIFKALALCLFAAVSLTLASCDDDMDIQQSYPFTVETMPVPNKVTKGQTVEIRPMTATCSKTRSSGCTIRLRATRRTTSSWWWRTISKIPTNWNLTSTTGT